MSSYPQHAQILVVGGGPSGSYAATALALEGFDVVLFEATKFPRYHVGESLIPSVRQYLKFIGVEAKVAGHGFAMKPGSAIKFTQYKREGYTDFVALGHDNASWNVIRSEFDQILLEHAASSGVRVFERTQVDSIEFDHSKKPISATFVSLDAPVESRISFDFLVDATGRAGMLSTKYFKDRKFTDSLKNSASWGYWSGVHSYGEGTSRHGAPWFEALSDSSGWAWFIPLHNGLTSVGVVMDQKTRSSQKRSNNEPPETETEPLPSLTQSLNTLLRSFTGFSLPPVISASSEMSPTASHYIASLALAPGLKNLIGDGKMVEYPLDRKSSNLVHTASDYSYCASKYAGNGWRIIGDAGAFIDPFFSSGVHLAFTGALSAAATISASIRGQCTETEASNWHHERVATSYTRFLVVVLSAYKQIRAQSTDVLCDVDEDNFDKAFKFLRPVIQGGADMGPRISEDELQRALDFCGKLFNPTTPAEHDVARTLVDSETGTGFMDVKAPVVDPGMLEQLSLAAAHADLSDTDISAADLRMILDKVNARRVIHSEHSNGVNNFEEEALGDEGFVVKLVQGQLGLVRADKTGE